MIQIFQIPLDDFPESFQIALAGVNYLMTVKWNDADMGGWYLDLQDANTNDFIAAGIPFITGMDLFSGLEYLGINGQFWITTNGDTFAVPTFDNLGTESNLYFVTDVTSG